MKGGKCGSRGVDIPLNAINSYFSDYVFQTKELGLLLLAEEVCICEDGVGI